MYWTRLRVVALVAMLLFAAKIAMPSAQQSSKALTNSDVIKMTKSGLAESTILAVIQASPSNFDVSPDALIAMKNAGVSQSLIAAVVTAGTNKPGSPAATPAPATTATNGTPAPAATPGSQVWPPPAGQAGNQNAAPPAKQPSPVAPSSAASPSAAGATKPTNAAPSSSSPTPNTPAVVMLPAGGSAGSGNSGDPVTLPLEKTQLSQTKTKSSSLAGLANDSMTGQALQTGVNTVAWEGAVHSGSTTSSIASSEAGNVFSSAMSHRKTTVTYLWAVQGASSATQANSNQPRFSVNFAGWMYVTLDDFEPVIVKLTPIPPPSSWRLVGASQGKEDAYSNSAVDWQAFSNFMQDPAPTQVKKISSGVYEVSAAQPLEAGEYGIVLRPISKTMKFSGADVARNQGNGKVFNSVWTFEVK